ncbi:MAG: sigma-54 dependent transcriptional regulator [Deltaproteobacteria bacterium]|nr:sigma-54 dependent transcriptional regulator [Deltaproteobacteria bacterium]
MYKGIELLIVEDDESMAKVLERLAKEYKWSYRVARNGVEALEIFNREVVEVALMDIKLPGFSGMQLLEHVKKGNFATEVIIITGVGTVETAVSAIKLGAYDYLTKPFDDIRKVAVLIEKARERYQLVQKIKTLERNTTDQFQFEEIVGKCNKMQEVYRLIESIAPTNATVMITGESGTGKELVARAIHRRSVRKDKPFIIINCAAIPEQLLESELFGHKKGSFTGAIADKKGLFEEADHGTLFLDEIGEVPPSIQVKLLRVLQEGEVRAVGGNQSRHVDVRLLAATNKDLAKLIKEGRFREDLYYRLNVISLHLPPLRERAEDISLLAYNFLKKHGDRLKKTVDKISVDVLQTLQNYNWTGNVRELENTMERAVVLVNGDTIYAKDLPPNILGDSFYLTEEAGVKDLTQYSYQDANDKALASFNRSYLANLLRQTSGNISIASEKAGMDRSNFKKIIKKYNIDTLEFKHADLHMYKNKG